MLCLCCRHPTSRQTSWIWTNTQTGSAAVVDLVLWVVLHSKSLPERVWHGCGLRLFTLYRAEGNNARKLPSLLKVIDSYLKTCHVDSCWKTCHVDSCWKTCHVDFCWKTCHVYFCWKKCHVDFCWKMCHVDFCWKTCHVVLLKNLPCRLILENLPCRLLLKRAM